MKKGVSILMFLVIGLAVNVYSQLPQDELWKNKLLYIGGSGGVGPIFGGDGTVLGGNISPLLVDWQMTKFLALGTGVNIYFGPKLNVTAPKQADPDSGIFETYGGMETHILFPLILKYTYKPGIFSLEAGGGIYVAPVAMNTTVERTNDNAYTVSEGYGKNLFTADRNNPFGFVVNGRFGVKAGQGILFLDVSYLRDFSEVTVKFNGENKGSHHWNMLAFNIGYKYGFFNSRKG